MTQKSVISCTGYCTKFIDSQWVEIGPPGKCAIEVVSPNIIHLKDLSGIVFRQIELLPGCKISKQDQFSLILRPDLGKNDFFGLRMIEASHAEFLFQEIHRISNPVQKTLETPNNAQKSPAENLQHQHQQDDLVKCNSENQKGPTSPPLTTNVETLEDVEESKIDLLCEKLATSIEKGQLQLAVEHVKILCQLKPCLTIHTLPKDTSYKPDDDFSIIVRITNQFEKEQSYQLPIGDPSKTTIRMLKHEIRQRLNIPIESQRWVLDRLLAADDHTLWKCGIKHNAQIAYLYLASCVTDEENGIQNHTQHPNMYDVPSLNPMYINQDAPHGAAAEEPQYESIDNYQHLSRIQQNQHFATGFASIQASPYDRPSYPQQNQAQSMMWIANSHMPQGMPTQAMNYVQNNLRNQQNANAPYDTLSRRGGGMNSRARLDVAHPPPQPTPQPPQVRKKAEPIGWNCPECTFKNLPTFPGCQICTEPRPIDYEIPEGYQLTKKEIERQESEKLNEKLALEAEFRRKEEEAKIAQENYRHVMNLAQKKVLPNQEEFDCAICYTTIDKGEGVMLRECLHCFCKECLMNHINTSEDPEVHCPENAGFPCPAVITGQEIEELLSPEDFQRFLDRSLKQAEYSAENSFHCRTTNCKGWCVYEDDVNEFRCMICAKVNCLTCKAQHPDMTCKAYQEDLRLRAQNDEAAKKTQEMLDELVNRGDAMRCPQCKVILQKKSGCDWMRCTMCKTEICWATKGPRWGPKGKGDTSGGCKCGVNGQRCTPNCGNCH